MVVKRVFWIFTVLIILFGFLTRIYIVHGNNLFFTADEGRDAIYVRQIINYHQIFTRGPESSVRGIFTGPLWYYFIAIGYSTLKGSPFGASLMLILLNLSIVIILIRTLKIEVDGKIALITGFGLMIFWSFFATSLYGFNPFPLVTLSIIIILLLLRNKYGLALIPIFLAFNTELAGAVAFLIFYIIYGAIQVFKKKLKVGKYLIYAFIIPGLGVIKITLDYLRQPKATTNSGLQVLTGTNFGQMLVEFGKMGFGFFLIIFFIYLFVKKKSLFIKRFVYLSFGLIIVSYFFFASTHGWREWHTVYIPPLIFITLLLMCYEMKRIGKLLIILILFFSIVNFKNNYLDYLRPKPDRSLLYNQERVLDWIYTHSENNGFNLYTYTDSFYDYSYQYLISWYAKDKYEFYPCEYANFPLSIKALYVPRPENYVTPQLGCDKFRFLVIDSLTNGNENENWINEFQNQTILVDKTQIGNTTIEKRRVPDKVR